MHGRSMRAMRTWSDHASGGTSASTLQRARQLAGGRVAIAPATLGAASGTGAQKSPRIQMTARHDERPSGPHRTLTFTGLPLASVMKRAISLAHAVRAQPSVLTATWAPHPSTG